MNLLRESRWTFHSTSYLSIYQRSFNISLVSGFLVAQQLRIQLRCRSRGWCGSDRGGYGNQLQYSCPENPMDRGARQATVHGATERRTLLKGLSTSNIACDPLWSLGLEQTRITHAMLTATLRALDKLIDFSKPYLPKVGRMVVLT